MAHSRASKKMGLFGSNQLSTIYKSHIRSQMECCSPLWNMGWGWPECLGETRQITKPGNTIRAINDKIITMKFHPTQDSMAKLEISKDVCKSFDNNLMALI